ncbi:MAG: rhodanese-like domain-containing protein, partial [Thermodesulfobacteriota bacterium]
MIKKTVALFFMFFLFVTGSVTAQSQDISECPLLDARELMNKINSGGKLVIVDVRAPQEYKKGHIPGAISIPGKETRKRIPLEINKKDNVVIVGLDGQFAWTTCRN